MPPIPTQNYDMIKNNLNLINRLFEVNVEKNAVTNNFLKENDLAPQILITRKKFHIF